MSHGISLTPETFTLVKFDAAELLAIAEAAATAVGVPDDVSIAIDVDEALPLPLIASLIDAEDGALSAWFTGGCFEDPKYQAILQPDISKTELAAAFLRGRDRLDGGFEDAPADGEISERQRAIWDVYTEGRVSRLGGFVVNEPRRRYTYRLRCGFNDIADAEYEALWSATSLSWAGLVEIEDRLAAADPRPATKKPIRHESLRPS
ncbi:MAG: hypothetical protein ACXVKA_03345 [Acidimicrobiia bacterium]